MKTFLFLLLRNNFYNIYLKTFPYRFKYIMKHGFYQTEYFSKTILTKQNMQVTEKGSKCV